VAAGEIRVDATPGLGVEFLDEVFERSDVEKRVSRAD